MTQATKERLYNLLPAVYKARDSLEGEPLRALLDLIEGEMRILEEDIEGLYDDWFIETCDDWVIPYIGDLLGVHAVHSLCAGKAKMRGYVANTIAYRRRKGTAAVLEQVSRDVTGWPSHAVEFFALLAVTQHLNHLRLDKGRTACVRDTDEIELAGGPFETTAHTLDVRRISTRGGKYNIPNIGIFLWRLQSYPLSQVTACKMGNEGNRYTFDPLGFEISLFNRPQTEDWIVHLSEEINVPGMLRRYPLYNELEALRNGEALQPSYFDPQPIFAIDITIDGETKPRRVPLKDIFICNMANWRDPPSLDNIESDVTGDEAKRIPIAIDPMRGKMTLPSKISLQKVLVSYSYGFSGDVGAGPYDRISSIQQTLAGEVDWQVGVSKEAADGKLIFETVQGALDAWSNRLHEEASGAKVGLIVIMDSRTYVEQNLTVSIPYGCQLLIVAADWPKPRLKGQFAARGLRPHLQGDIKIFGGTDPGLGPDPGELVIDGLLIEGNLSVLKDNLRLRIAHTTQMVRDNICGIKIDGASSVELTIDRSICGSIEIGGNASGLILNESIVNDSIIAENTPAQIDLCTILGISNLRRLQASNSIFMGKVTVKQRQDGCVRFSYLPYDSPSPRRFRCQPDLAIAAKKEALGRDLSDEEKKAVKNRLRPAFTSVHYGDPGYVQLSFASAKEVRTGAEDGSENGVFGILEQPLREANLKAALEEYMRFGLEAGIFYMT
ncbi:MAG: hypothetical protein PHN61_06095 [Methanothrix sp.]|nr:hypothetical protein [Methanothrix sp.]